MILPSTGTALAALLWVAPAVSAPVEPAIPPVWDQLAACESDRTWDANTGNGFYGGLQFEVRSWEWAGGVGMPHEAAPHVQVEVAERLLELQGWGAWPVCSVKIGVR